MPEYDESLMKGVVHHLGSDWIASYDYRQVELITLDGHSLRLTDGDMYCYADSADRGKLIAYVSFGAFQGCASSDFRSTIRISKGKGAAKIAAEIRRRLLLAYWAEFAAAQEKKRAIDDRAEARFAQVKELAKITGGHTYRINGSSRKGELDDAMNSTHVGAEFNYDGTFKLSVKAVPADVVADLVRFIHNRLQGLPLSGVA